jgi:hypothetical protein
MAETNTIQPGLYDGLPQGEAGASAAQEIPHALGHLTSLDNRLPQR